MRACKSLVPTDLKLCYTRYKPDELIKGAEQPIDRNYLTPKHIQPAEHALIQEMLAAKQIEPSKSTCRIPHF
ncbi:hypothetical protein A3Q56_06280 [Intoshia linei]|uniref:Uncharacterized protein n=1 Tax=Intoshia linei TaxID=1819745 RepID=A0A177AXT0_9BILA|nr:hypothetical protein A3Q56_06280 [Intoshia linei]